MRAFAPPTPEVGGTRDFKTKIQVMREVPPFLNPVTYYLLLANLSPCYELIPEDSSENILQAKVRLHQAPSRGHHGQLERSYHADLRDEGLKGWSETEGDGTIGI